MRAFYFLKQACCRKRWHDLTFFCVCVVDAVQFFCGLRKVDRQTSQRYPLRDVFGLRTVTKYNEESWAFISQTRLLHLVQLLTVHHSTAIHRDSLSKNFRCFFFYYWTRTGKIKCPTGTQGDPEGDCNIYRASMLHIRLWITLLPTTCVCWNTSSIWQCLYYSPLIFIFLKMTISRGTGTTGRSPFGLLLKRCHDLPSAALQKMAFQKKNCTATTECASLASESF